MGVRNRHSRLLAAVLLAVFANFFCGSKLFVHTHMLGGFAITHSHPCLPATTHSHSGAAAQAIAQLNDAFQLMDAAAIIAVDAPAASHFVVINISAEHRVCVGSRLSEHLRGPPQAA